MGMSTQAAGGVKAEPNVVPMIDVMLVLLIIFMVVTPAIAAGFSAVPPTGINLKSHPETDEDQVLGIDKDGQYYLNKNPIPNDNLPALLKATYDARTLDKVLYIKADRDLEYWRILEAMDIASRNGVRVVGAISDQLPGTVSTVEGDEVSSSLKIGP